MADVSFVSAAQAKEIDEKLMGPEFGFSIDQLMELAGLSVASALCEVYPPRSYGRVLVLCGPGNNGGDGLVAARHLYHFGYDVEVCYPKRTDRPIYNGLVTQLNTLGIHFVDAETLSGGDPLVTKCDVVVDALFGFSFTGAPRAPFDALLELINPHNAPPPIVAVDIPSGWSGPSCSCRSQRRSSARRRSRGPIISWEEGSCPRGSRHISTSSCRSTWEAISARGCRGYSRPAGVGSASSRDRRWEAS